MLNRLQQIFVNFRFSFHNVAGPSEKNYFELFFSARGSLLVCKILGFTDTSNMFFANECHVFDKYAMAIFFLQILYSFSPLRNGIFTFGSKLSRIICLYFSKLFNSLIQWPDTQCIELMKQSIYVVREYSSQFWRSKCFVK